MARIVVAGMPHHITQRGNRREAVFFGDPGRRECLQRVGCAGSSRRCLPRRFRTRKAAMAWIARRRLGLPGRLRHGRVLSTVLDEPHLYGGRPCGSDSFVKNIETALDRQLAPAKRGPKPGHKPKDLPCDEHPNLSRSLPS